MRPLPSAWNDPPWTAPLDAEACVRAVPAEASMTGMFLAAVNDVARSRGVSVRSGRERYTPFQRYPLREQKVPWQRFARWQSRTCCT